MTTENRRRPVAETLRDDTAQVATAWRSSVEAIWGGYRDQVRRFGELNNGLLGGFRLFDPERARESFGRIAEGTRAVTSAQVAVAGELLRAPLWLTGAASPVDLQNRYLSLLEARRELFRSYIESVAGWQQSAASAAEQTTERVATTLRGAVDAQTDVAEGVARAVTQAQSASVEATRATAETVRATAERTAAQTRETVSRAVEQAREVVEEASEVARREAAAAQRQAERERAQREEAERAEQERIEREAARAERARQREQAERERQRAEREEAERLERERAERERLRAERARERERAEQERARLANRLIKGNITREGEKIYHLPGQATYERVQAEETFDTEEQAQAAGFRRSQAAGGGTIKGKVNREGEKIYHLPGQANYDRIEADQLFESEEQAQANGFRAAQR